jgi:Flp pilus assembly protein TadD
VARSNFATALIAGNNASAALEILEPLLLTVQSQKIGFMEATVRRNLGRALSLAGRTAEAERELSTAYRLSAERGEIENARAAAGALADAFLAAGRSSEAKVWRDRSLHESEQR